MGIELSMDSQDHQNGDEQATSDYALLRLGFAFLVVLVFATLGNPIQHAMTRLSAWVVGLKPP